ncbi:MAG: VWA domain-containing protein, partial [Candidatus Binatus sp.]
RRLRLANTGRIDFRRTIRAAMQRGGALLDLKFRARRPRHVDLVILADISGSVRYAAQLMLELMAGARGCFRRVSSFVYVDHLAEADFEEGHLVMTPALDLYARSDFGRVLGELWQRRAGLLTRSTIVVIMGDGRNNRLPARADVVRDISRSCRAVVWLNPEDPVRWGTGDSAIKQYAREVKMLVPSRNLRELQVALSAIA